MASKAKLALISQSMRMLKGQGKVFPCTECRQHSCWNGLLECELVWAGNNLRTIDYFLFNIQRNKNWGLEIESNTKQYNWGKTQPSQSSACLIWNLNRSHRYLPSLQWTQYLVPEGNILWTFGPMSLFIKYWKDDSLLHCTSMPIMMTKLNKEYQAVL